MGIVYVLSNPAMPELHKIGFSNDDEVDYRITDLWSSGVPEPFKLEAYSKNSDARQLEKQIHKLLDEYRLNKDREFFKIPIESLLEILQTSLPNIEWNIGETYELKKKKNWLDSFKRELTKLSYDVEEFEKYAESKNWFYGKIQNKFEANIKNKVKYLKEAIERRDTRINEKNNKYIKDDIKDDDKYARDELKDILKNFQDFKSNLEH